jgi:Flp pilus assembly protein TadG
MRCNYNCLEDQSSFCVSVVSRRTGRGLRKVQSEFLSRVGAVLRDRRGMSAVEFGLAAPVFLAMLTPVIDIGLAFSEQIRVNQAVEAGAQYATSNPYGGSSWSSNVQAAINNATTLSSDSTWSRSVSAESCGCPNSTNTDVVTGVSYGTAPNCTPGSCPDNSNPGYYVTITASVTYTPVMPYSILGNSPPPTLSSQTIVRVQ